MKTLNFIQLWHRIYILTAQIFYEAEIKLGNIEKLLKITTNSTKGKYIKSAKLNGEII